VNESLVEDLKAKGLPASQCVGCTDSTKWLKEADGIRIEWSEAD